MTPEQTEETKGAQTAPSLPSLKDRVIAARAPGRDLDCLIAVAIGGFVIDGERYGEPCYCHTVNGEYHSPGQGGDMLVPRYTASIDAALTLMAAKLPGWAWMTGCAPGEGFFADMQTMDDDGPSFDARAIAATPALAILACLLNAMIKLDAARPAPTADFSPGLDQTGDPL